MEDFDFNHKELSDMDQQFMENALKLYFFFKHVDLTTLTNDLAERFRYNQSVIYSLIRSYLLDNRFAIEYMDHLNQELKKLADLDALHLAPLTIKPTEISEIELQDKIPVRFEDEEEEQTVEMVYFSEKGLCFYRFIEK